MNYLKNWPHVKDLLFYLLVFCLPFGTRKILLANSGGFNEWLSVSLFLTDILLAMFLVVWGWGGVSRASRAKLDWPDYALFVFLLCAVASILVSIQANLAIVAVVRLLLLVTFYYASSEYWRHSQKRLITLGTLFFSGAIQAIVALGQNLFQRDLGLRWLGESVLRTNLNGVAVVPLASGGDVLRAYGTLPHSNVLAIFLLLAFWAGLYLFCCGELGPQLKKPTLVSLSLIFYAWLATFSRGVIGVGLVTTIFALYPLICRAGWKQTKSVGLAVIISGLTFVSLNYSAVLARSTISPDEQAVSLRLVYNHIGAATVKSHLGLGVGMGNFVYWLRAHAPNLPAWAWQPIHNLYLLIASEIGLLGALVFMLFLTGLLWRARARPLWSNLPLVAFMLVALFDHFFWSLTAGSLIFWLGLGWSRAMAEGENIVTLNYGSRTK